MIFDSCIVRLFDVSFSFQCCFVNIDSTNLFIATSILKNPEIPIIFKNVKGKCTDSNDSYRNDDEIDVVIKYVRELLDGTWNGKELIGDDIGINSLIWLLSFFVVLKCLS